MPDLSGNDIRKHFLDYFAGKGHKVLPSSPVFPEDDPTLLFTNAGMNQFKKVFQGEETRGYNRAATSQKCIRVSGKHNDLENVGFTARHHTFFEMLGNFSFGDYFKEEAIDFCWDLMVKEFGLPVEKLWITIYEEDDQAAELWGKVTGIPADKIYRMGAKDNYWSMGDVGPCGPCSEIGIDQGEALGCGRPTCDVGCDCDRYLELWNLVFMQFNRDESGKLTPLPKPSIDTGMGLERIAAVLQRKTSNYDSDLFTPLIDKIGQLSGKPYDPGLDGMAFRVIADHARALAFAIADGVMPSNEGRGYVVRLILRRAARFGRKLDLTEPFIHTLLPTVRDLFASAYPELSQSIEHVSAVVHSEEESFSRTYEKGLTLFDKAVGKLPAGGLIPGQTSFELHDTYGFLIDMLGDMARERGFEVDREGFNKLMKQQKERARRDRQGKVKKVDRTDNDNFGIEAESQFRGYGETELETELLRILVDGNVVPEATAPDEVIVYLKQTPFYAESGGQLADTGEIVSASGRGRVADCQYDDNDLIYHLVKIETGELSTGAKITARVDIDKRRDTERNHTATHLLQGALRKVLGEHVKQSGSLVAPDRLRFDFTHFAPMNDSELEKVEAIVNQIVRDDRLVNVSEDVPIEQAKERGATALFGEKYGERVRTVEVDRFSIELCGGTHLRRTGEIGLFQLVSESGIAAGTRRIEAVTGPVAYNRDRQDRRRLEQLSSLLGVPREKAVDRVKQLLDDVKSAEKSTARKKKHGYREIAEKAAGNMTTVAGIELAAGRFDVGSIDELKLIADHFRELRPDSVAVLAAEVKGKAAYVVTVGDKILDRVKAGQFIKELAPIAGGGGGGRDHLAQAGAPDTGKIDAVLKSAPEILKKIIGD